MLNGILQSKRFWAAVGSIAVIVLKDNFNLPVSEDQIQQLIYIVGAWIVGDSLRATAPKDEAAKA